MTVRKVEIERFSVISSKPFETVVAALKAGVGNPTWLSFWRRFGAHGPSRSSNALFKEAWAGRG